MRKQVLSFGLALLLGNWIQAAAALSHHCMGAESHAGLPAVPQTAAESTPAATPVHSGNEDHSCCPRSAPAAASEVNYASEITCRGNSMDCCVLQEPGFNVALPTRQSLKAFSTARFVAGTGEPMPSARALSQEASNLFRTKISSVPSTSLRL